MKGFEPFSDQKTKEIASATTLGQEIKLTVPAGFIFESVGIGPETASVGALLVSAAANDNVASAQRRFNVNWGRRWIRRGIGGLVSKGYDWTGHIQAPFTGQDITVTASIYNETGTRVKMLLGVTGQRPK